MNPVAQVIGVKDGDARYEAIMVWCPGCEYTDEDGHKFGGLNMLSISRTSGGSDQPRPTWGWNGELEKVTLNPSILTHSKRGEGQVEFACHSYLQNGQWRFLSDCTHSLANQTVPMVPLPDWVVRSA